MPPSPPLRAAIDIGGSFTDLMFLDAGDAAALARALAERTVTSPGVYGG